MSGDAATHGDTERQGAGPHEGPGALPFPDPLPLLRGPRSNGDMGDELFENETETTMTREQAAAALHALADAPLVFSGSVSPLSASGSPARTGPSPSRASPTGPGTSCPDPAPRSAASGSPPSPRAAGVESCPAVPESPRVGRGRSSGTSAPPLRSRGDERCCDPTELDSYKFAL
ncbi:hypothetical protein MOPEL_130_01940 [Mobilicoccus pelagius NBRC 104925]|uniref:Uncharacterized protein n=1 Tax=Mobilicoccus pelagius NBRC 104925 TaxID=1089455 RepID=H5UV29_9MICO|nr:hypothetical protein MOPEL_130_01940 [Mobilicoccus pelagius NBRC 104925]